MYRSITLSALAVVIFSTAIFNSREPVRPPELLQNAKPLDWLQELARFEPPPYQGEVDAGIEEDAALQFEATMAFYRRGAYQMAIAGLRETLELDSRAVGARFYLGICLLMSGEIEQGEQTLEDTVFWGDPRYKKAALRYGARANLKLYRVDRAHAMLLDSGESLAKLLTGG